MFKYLSSISTSQQKYSKILRILLATNIQYQIYQLNQDRLSVNQCSKSCDKNRIEISVRLFFFQIHLIFQLE